MADPVSLSVRGSASLEVTPDFAVVTVVLSARDPDQREALGVVRGSLADLRAGLAAADGVRESRFSGVRVDQETHYDQTSGEQTPTGWHVEVRGELEVSPAAVGPVVELTAGSGGGVTWVQWRVEPDNAGYREVRRRAVADARRAAEDFAHAVGGALGPLTALADPGLLGDEPAPAGVALLRGRPASGGPGMPEGTELDLDPRPVLLQASVEARYRLAQ
jgi:uncharacterized protein